MTKPWISLAGGLAGACALTALHEIIRRQNSKAPRMDLLGMSALSTLIKKSGGTPPGRKELFTVTMAGDIAGNALLYSMTGAGNRRGVWLRGLLLGLAAGAGAVYLPGPVGLPEGTSNRTQTTKLLTFALYTAGGLVAAAAIDLLTEKNAGEPVGS